MLVFEEYGSLCVIDGQHHFHVAPSVIPQTAETYKFMFVVTVRHSGFKYKTKKDTDMESV